MNQHIAEIIKRFPWFNEAKTLFRVVEMLTGIDHIECIKREMQYLVPKAIIYFSRVVRKEAKFPMKQQGNNEVIHKLNLLFLEVP